MTMRKPESRYWRSQLAILATAELAKLADMGFIERPRAETPSRLSAKPRPRCRRPRRDSRAARRSLTTSDDDGDCDPPPRTIADGLAVQP